MIPADSITSRGAEARKLLTSCARLSASSVWRKLRSNTGWERSIRMSRMPPSPS
jgi:hypothetical protein